MLASLPMWYAARGRSLHWGQVLHSDILADILADILEREGCLAPRENVGM